MWYGGTAYNRTVYASPLKRLGVPCAGNAASLTVTQRGSFAYTAGQKLSGKEIKSLEKELSKKLKQMFL
jgi:hypothetical protein